MARTRTILFLIAGLIGAGGCGSRSGQSALKQGLAAFQEKNYELAITQLTRASKRITDSADLYYTLGVAHLHLGDLAPAQTAFNAALEQAQGPQGHARASACLGQIAYLQNDLPKAQACFEQALAGADQKELKAQVLASLALVDQGQDRPDIARLHLLQAIQLNRKYAPAYYNLASLYRDKFNLREEALDNFELFVRQADKEDPHYESAVNNIKRLRPNLERLHNDAADSQRRDPALAAKHLQEGIKAQVDKQYAKAAKAYREALAADPLTFHAAFGLGMVCKAQGQRAEALEAFRRAAEISPNHQDSYLFAAEQALLLKRTAEAAKILDRAIARSPFNSASADLMARIRYAETRLPEARAYGEFYLSLLAPGDKNRAAYQKWVNALPAK